MSCAAGSCAAGEASAGGLALKGLPPEVAHANKKTKDRRNCPEAVSMMDSLHVRPVGDRD